MFMGSLLLLCCPQFTLPVQSFSLPRRGMLTLKRPHLLSFCCASTRAMNANSSCNESKWVDCPDTTCSTRPSIRPCVMSVLRRKCTTNAQWTDKGAFVGFCCVMLVLRLCLWLAIARVLCQENTNALRRSPGKTPGFLRDFSG